MRRFFAVLTAAALALTLAGCGREPSGQDPGATDQPNPTEAPRGPVTLNVVTSYGGDDGNRKNFEAAVAEYEALTGNRVADGSAISNEEWKARVLADFETGSEPDVLFFFTNADADPLISAGKVVSIEEIREVYPDYATNMRLSMMATATDGKHYAVPSSGYWENMFVNRRVLNACNVRLPGPDYSWEQFLADCETIQKNGYTPIACSLYDVPHYWFEFAVMNNGSLETQLDIPALDENGQLIDDPVSQKWIAALEDIKDLYARGYFPANTLTATDAETVSMFGEGKAAFLIDGSWKVGYFTENHPGQLADYVVSYVPAKGERKASEAIGGISMGYFISRRAWEDPAKRPAAVSFIAHLTSDEVLSTFVTTEVTALVDGARPSGLNLIQQSAAEANSCITGVAGAVQDTITGEAKSALFGSIQKVVTGRMTPEAAITAALKLN